jgi:hypothetical protein
LVKIEICDDSGDEISKLTVPIPFYIRVFLEEGMSRYRVRLIDDEGYLRGQYTGTATRNILELHIPLINLPKPGKLRILVEESSGDSQNSPQQHLSVLYLNYNLNKDIQKELTLINK